MNTYFSLDQHDQIHIIRVNDLLSEEAIVELLDAAERQILDGYPNFVVDLSRITYMNSVGINFLIRLKRRAAEYGGQLVVCSASDKVKQLLEITKLRSRFSLTDTLDEAIKSLSTP